MYDKNNKKSVLWILANLYIFLTSLLSITNFSCSSNGGFLRLFFPFNGSD